MAINLEVSDKLKLNSNKNNLKIHYIPASTAGNGCCNLETMFENYTIEQNDHLTNSLRGYPLRGIHFQLPESYVGVAFEEKIKPLDENANRKWKAVGTFENFSYWNYDKMPSKEDPLQKALDLIKISETMCNEISEEMLEQQTKEYQRRLNQMENEKKEPK